jgi:DNA-binding transcriptional MerR regulator
VALAKSPDAFRTISEAADELGVPQHVLRFWETKFVFIRPLKRAGGRRFYRRNDLEILKGVRVLLHEQGYTIKGVQKLHKDHGVRKLVAAAGGELSGVEEAEAEPDAGAVAVARSDAAASGGGLGGVARERLMAALEELEAAKAKLDLMLPHDNN